MSERTADEVLKDIKKQLPNARLFKGSDEEVQVKTQSWGIPALDELTGGIVCGGFTFLYGTKAVGKSSISGKATGHMQECGRKMLMIDLENRIDPKWWETQGVTLKDLDVLRGGLDFEEDMDAAFALIRENVYGGIVMDSLTAKAARGELEDKKGKQKSLTDDTVALLARKLSEFYRKVSPSVAVAKVPVLILSQVRATNLHQGAFLAMTGGNASQHWASTIVQLSRAGKIKATRGGEIVELGFWIKALLKKTSITSNEGLSVMLPFYFGIGIDDVAAAVRKGIDKGVVKKGATSSVKFNDKTYRSENNMVEKLREDDALKTMLYEMVADSQPVTNDNEDGEDLEEVLDVAEDVTEDAAPTPSTDDEYICTIEQCGQVLASAHGLKIHQGRSHKK